MPLATVRTAVLPVAGHGTRFLPATRAIPKELLPVVDRPVIHYTIAEAEAAGIQRFVFVTARGKSVIEDHFDRHPHLERFLHESGKAEQLEAVISEVPGPGAIAYVRQGVPRGLGHAIACAREVVGGEPFAVMLPDEMILADQPAIGSLLAARERLGGGHVLGVQPVAAEEVDQYGIVETDDATDDVMQVRGIVEKPSPDSVSSRLAVVGRYVLEPEIFEVLDQVPAGAGGEVQLTDALARLVGDGRVHAMMVAGERFDCGSKVGLLKANITHALEREELREPLLEFIRQLKL